MIRIFKTIDGQTQKISEPAAGSWVALTDPTMEELATTADRFKIDLDDLKSPLDEEERSRIQVEDDYTLIILDIPTTDITQEKDIFYTIPFGIIVKDEIILTVCLVDTPILAIFMEGRVRNFSTTKRTRFIYQMLYRRRAPRRLQRKSCTFPRETRSFSICWSWRRALSISLPL